MRPLQVIRSVFEEDRGVGVWICIGLLDGGLERVHVVDRDGGREASDGEGQGRQQSKSANSEIRSTKQIQNPDS